MGATRGGAPTGSGLTLLLSFLLLCFTCHCHVVPDETQGCFVSYEEDKIQIACNKITSFSSVADSLPASDQKVSSLMITRSPRLSITRANLNSSVYQDIKELFLLGNFYTTFQPHPIQHLSKLKYLALTANYLTTLNADTFSGLGSITLLSLNDNVITYISPGAFKSMPNLNNLDLSDNKLTSIGANIFQALSVLRRLDMSGNAITSIEAGSFNGLLTLGRLDLSDNKIKTIDYRAFQALNGLQLLKLGRNELENLDRRVFDNNPLVILDLSHNKLENLENFPLNNSILRQLDLNNCSIQNIPVDYFENVPYLVILSMRNNRIAELDASLIAPLFRLRQLHLTSNNLTSLDVASFQQLHRILNQPAIDYGHFESVTNEVDLRNNPWDCSTEDMAEVRTWASHNGVDFDTMFNCIQVRMG